MSALYGEIEIGLHRVRPEAYDVELRVTDPDTQGQISPAKGQVQLSFEDLLELQNTPEQYGLTLTAQLFQDDQIRERFVQTRAAFESRGQKLRLRLLIGPSVPELHGIRWELLCDPETHSPMATSERILFSRFMLSQDWRVVKLQPKAELKALIAVSGPSDLATYRLTDVDLAGEVARAREGLAGIEANVIGQEQPLTLVRLVAAIRPGVDILYMVCHGTLTRNLEPLLFLQTDNGKAAVVKGADLALRISELAQPPRLIVLASCESAGREDDAATAPRAPIAQASLAPRLAEAGVPAVVAMQGKISMETVKLAMPVFFSELLKDGQIDRAMAVARGSVRERADSWMPTLFLRLKSGRIWYEPGFAGGKSGEKSEFEQWQSVCRFVKRGECVPIIGPDLAEHVYGSMRSIANDLALQNGFPLSPYDRSDLAKVAQYISNRSSPRDLRNQVRDALAERLRATAEKLFGKVETSLNPRELMDRVVAELLKDENDPLNIVASLNAKVYITAAADPLLELFLQKAGKPPVELVSRWRDERRETRDEPDVKGDPTPENPFLYYVYGKSKYEETWVLTEDDFFDYLIRTSKYDLMPLTVSESLTGNSLLFLGFPLDDWRFRTLFRMIMAKEGSGHLADYNHVGVQLDPDEHTLADAERAKKNLEQYFNKSRITIFWGSVSDFLLQLRDQLKKCQAEEPDVHLAKESMSW